MFVSPVEVEAPEAAIPIPTKPKYPFRVSEAFGVIPGMESDGYYDDGYQETDEALQLPTGPIYRKVSSLKTCRKSIHTSSLLKLDFIVEYSSIEENRTRSSHHHCTFLQHHGSYQGRLSSHNYQSQSIEDIS